MTDFLSIGGGDTQQVPATTRSTAARALNTNFVINAVRPVFVTYCVRIAAAAGEQGRVQLLSDAAAPPTTVLAQAGSTVGAAGGGGTANQSLPPTWFQDNVAANQNNVPMAAGGGSAGGTVWRATRAGSIVGISIQASELVTAGHINVTVTINGVPTFVGCGSALTPPGQLGDQETVAPGGAAYVAGDLIGVVVFTDAGFLPNTLDLSAWVEVAEATDAGSGQSVSTDVLVEGFVYPGHNVRIATISSVGAPAFTFLSAMEVVL